MSEPDAVPPDTGPPDAVEVEAVPVIGAQLGRFRLLRRIGGGGMGVVYEARDDLLQRRVAVKRLALPPEPALRERFLREARAAARLSHPNVVAIHEIVPDADPPFLVMELVDGPSAAELVRAAGPLPWPVAARIAADACRALAAAHAAGLVHRDVKPGNIVVGVEGDQWRAESAGETPAAAPSPGHLRLSTVKLTDFGLVKAFAAEGSPSTAGQTVGTPQYLSPEQARGESVDARSDLYSLGATLFTLLTARLPYPDAADAPAALYAHCFAPVPDPAEFVPGLPDGCRAVVRRAMAKDRTARYQTAGEMLADLSALAAADAQPALARPAVRPGGPPPGKSGDTFVLPATTPRRGVRAGGALAVPAAAAGAGALAVAGLIAWAVARHRNRPTGNGWPRRGSTARCGSGRSPPTGPANPRC